MLQRQSAFLFVVIVALVLVPFKVKAANESPAKIIQKSGAAGKWCSEPIHDRFAPDRYTRFEVTVTNDAKVHKRHLLKLYSRKAEVLLSEQSYTLISSKGPNLEFNSYRLQSANMEFLWVMPGRVGVKWREEVLDLERCRR